MEFGLYRTMWTVRKGRGVRIRIIEIEFVWNLVSFGPCGLSVIERCPYTYYRGRVCMEFGLFRTTWIVRNERCPYCRGRVCMEFGSSGPCGLSVIERCPYYRGRVCMEFGLFRTMWTVLNRELSVL